MPNKLNNPAKRLAFVGLIASAMWFGGLLLLPFSFEKREEWREISGTESVDRKIVRVDTACADRVTWGDGQFAKDVWILASVQNPYIFIEDPERDGFRIAPVLDYDESLIASTKARLAGATPICAGSLCVKALVPSSFEYILKTCGKSVGQHRETTWLFPHIVSRRTDERALWLNVSLLGTFLFLFSSVLYDQTLGRLVSWIRLGGEP